MLAVTQRKMSRYCDSMSRRHFLRVGGLGMAGLSLADLLRLKANGEIRAAARDKSVIMVYLPGGPSHLDMYDMKPNAPVEFRGEFNPIRTNVPGIDVCELMPRHVGIADKFTVVQGLRTFGNGHDPYEIISSDPRAATKLPPNPLPAFGSVVSKVRGVAGRDVPPYVSIDNLHLLRPSLNDDPETAAYLGKVNEPFRMTGPGLKKFSRPDDVTLDRLEERKTLLRSFDNLQHALDQGKQATAVDRYTEQALAMISSSRVRDAFDLSQERESVRKLYGPATDFLLARRLVEAGVSVVTLPGRFPATIGNFPRGSSDHWDTHRHNFKFLRLMLPQYDRAISALISDIYQRGLDKDVLVVVWGEFGRTPKVDTVPGFVGGRGHWLEAGFILMAGGGLKMGQVVRETDGYGMRARGQPATPANVLATIYHVLGIDSRRTFLDHFGRPRSILDNPAPIHELI